MFDDNGLHTAFPRTPVYRRLTRQILRHQERLRAACSPAAWRIYLRLEAAVNARAAHVTRLAFEAGRRAVRMQ